LTEKVKYFYQIGILNVLFDGLEENSKRTFLRSLKKNPWAFVFKYPPISTSDLKDFEQFDDYFLYHPIICDSRLYYINKQDLMKVKLNIRRSVKNEFTVFKFRWN